MTAWTSCITATMPLCRCHEQEISYDQRVKRWRCRKGHFARPLYARVR